MTISQILKEELPKIRELCLCFPQSSKPIDDAVIFLTKRIIESEIERLINLRDTFYLKDDWIKGYFEALTDVITHLDSELKLIEHE
jgi:hypothetical protein